MKPLAITLGDPAGIGAEVVFKALDELDARVWLFGNRGYAERAGSVPRVDRFVDIGDPLQPLRFGVAEAEYGGIALASIDAAAAAVERGDCSALVTAPINKQSILAAGVSFPGHTELLAARAGLKRYAFDYAMYFDSPTLRAVLHTVHLPLRDAIAAISEESVAALARLTAREYPRIHGGGPPRIAAAAVNPHAGEGGRFGDEESAIERAVEAVRREGIDISGPHPADTIFRAAREGKYDVVLAMYHDQALIPIKTLEFDRSVNVTLGLPYLRCSVDHGTAFDIAGKGIADSRPMRYAIEWAARHVERYTR